MNDRQGVPRRTFLLASAAAVPFLGTLACAGESEGEKCIATVESQYGPFYRKGAPWRAKLYEGEEAGEALHVAGRITSAQDCAPLRGATLDVWQASAAGFYDNNDPGRPFDPARYHLRGRVRTDADGRYRFESVMPGNYGQGSFLRARHIHLLVTAPGHAPLVTEIYFEGDRHNDTDRLVRRTLITRFDRSTHDGRAARRGLFDIVLTR
jgi:protocatechuate 3,4-dioxygenase beta subunit